MSIFSLILLDEEEALRDSLGIDAESLDIKVLLRSIYVMPKYMWLLCLTHLFCWMCLATYALYFTDYVGQAVFGGETREAAI